MKRPVTTNENILINYVIIKKAAPRGAYIYNEFYLYVRITLIYMKRYGYTLVIQTEG